MSLVKPAVETDVHATVAPARHRRLTAREIESLVQRYEAGATVYVLADEFGIARRTVSKQLKAAGVSLRCGPLSRDEIARAVQLYVKGLSIAAVGRELDRDPAGIWRALRAEGVVLRDSHGRERVSS